MINEHKDYVAKLKWARQHGLDLRELIMGELLSEEHRSSIAASLLARRDMTEDMVREGLERIAGLFGSVDEVNVDQRTQDVNRLQWLVPDVSVSDRVVMVTQQVESFLRHNQVTHIFVPNGRWEAGPGETVAQAIKQGLLPPCFQEEVKKQVEYENASPDPDKVVNIMDQLGQKWAQYEQIAGRKCQERQP